MTDRNTIAISVKNLNKTFSFSVKDENKAFWSNLFSPTKKTVEAVKNISFEVTRGERLAFIGPNGAGKSTTIKMLTGILFPTSGKINVLGLNPQTDRKKLAYKIGTVFGQRSQLFPNLPLTDSLYFFGIISGLIFYFFSVFANTAAFYFEDSRSVVQGVFEFLISPSLFHGGAFQGLLRNFFIFVIPALLIGAYPLETVRDLNIYKFFLILSITFIWGIISIYLFNKSIRKYESSNFINFG